MVKNYRACASSSPENAFEWSAPRNPCADTKRPPTLAFTATDSLAEGQRIQRARSHRRANSDKLGASGHQLRLMDMVHAKLKLPSKQGLCELWPSIRVAQKVGARLGEREILFR
jgi:hypothetical protein